MAYAAGAGSGRPFGEGSRMEMLQMLGVSAVAGIMSLGSFVAVAVYVIARWRTYREQAPADPHLGLKTALAWFSTLAFQAALVGLFMFAYGLFTKGEGGDLIRSAMGILLPAALVYGAHFVALTRTNAAELPVVVRMFSGASLIVSGTVGFVVLILAFTTLFQRGESGDFGRTVLAAVLVWPVAWIVQGWRFLQKSNLAGGGLPPGSGAFARPVPPPAVPVPPPAVPPPGSGSYPQR
jgi:hypothetical protein